MVVFALVAIVVGIVFVISLLNDIRQSARKIADDIAAIRLFKETGPEVEFAKQQFKKESSRYPMRSQTETVPIKSKLRHYPKTAHGRATAIVPRPQAPRMNNKSIDSSA
jgi:hypothetical protein